MASIRKLSSGKWKAEIVIRQGADKKPFRRSRVFTRKGEASAWAETAERKLRQPGGIERQVLHDRIGRPTIGDLIRRYIDEVRKPYGRSKKDYLRRLQSFDFADRVAEDLEADDWLDFARSLSQDGREPSTVAGLFGTLTSVMEIAKSGWRVDIDIGAIRDARFTANHMGYTGKSKKRERRPTLDEIDTLMEASLTIWSNNRRLLPLHFLIAYAIMSGRRQAEITRLQHEDVSSARIVVRDMKSPRGSVGNHRSLWILPQARAISEAHNQAVGRDAKRLFPYHPDTVSRRFTELVNALGIQDLHFHDLRHECCSWLGETGWTPQQIMRLTGHESLQQVDRYTQLEDVGDKYADWKWFRILREHG